MIKREVERAIDGLFVPMDISSDWSHIGGVHVTGNENANLEIYGVTRRSFEPALSISVNKFSGLNFTIGAVEDYVVKICAWENHVDDFNPYCFVPVETGDVYIDLGKILYGKKTVISFLTFAQNLDGRGVDSAISISDLTFWYRPNTDIVDDNGVCKDINAHPQPVGEQKCRCRNGFVASNGGRIQTIMDDCVPCQFSEYCAFEGDRCGINDDVICYGGDTSCVDDLCETNVSHAHYFLFSFQCNVPDF